MTATAHTDATTIDRIEVPAAMVPGMTDRRSLNYHARRVISHLRDLRDAMDAGQSACAVEAMTDAALAFGRWDGCLIIREIGGDEHHPGRDHARRLIRAARMAFAAWLKGRR